MSGHLAFPRTDGGLVPASLSPFFLRTVLREKMGFSGIIITDDLMMIGALAHLGTLARTAKQALLAGNDIIMFSTTPRLWDPVWTHLADSMKEEDFRLTVRSSARRVIEFKLRYLRGEGAVPLVPDPRRAVTDLPYAEGQPFCLNLAARSATIVIPQQEPNSVFPVTLENAGRVLLAGKYRDFFNYGRMAFPNASVYRYFEEWSTAEFISRAHNADTIIFCLSDAWDLRLLRSIERLNKNVIVLSILSPVHIENAPWVNGAVAVYSYAPESFAAGFSAITGKIKADGILPYER
jgi:beta-N-acetylhexosaminidase